jgi:RNA polymerase sigma-70 factor (ECF subfamily)
MTTAAMLRSPPTLECVPVRVGPDPEEMLVRRLRGGDPTAFEELVRSHGPRLLAVARRLCGDADEAQDALQDAFLCAFRSIDGFHSTARLGTWLHRIVVNAALMKLRARRRRGHVVVESALSGGDDRWLEQRSVIEEDLDSAERAETRAVVRRAIDGMPERYRTVLVLRDIEELDTASVAEALNITPNAVKIRLHRARQALKQRLVRARVEGMVGAA